MNLEYVDNKWYIDGEEWPYEFVKAIFPVEHQIMVADKWDLVADDYEDEVRDLLREDIDRWRKSALADLECERKWRAR
jgi:hypothetical protein